MCVGGVGYAGHPWIGFKNDIDAHKKKNYSFMILQHSV